MSICVGPVILSLRSPEIGYIGNMPAISCKSSIRSMSNISIGDRLVGNVLIAKTHVVCVVTTVYRWEQGLGGAPDVPHTVDVSLHVTEGNGVGNLKAPPVFLDTIKKEITQQSMQEAILLSFQFQVTDNTCVKWETALLKNKLYVQVPSGILPDGSKEAFVTLLELAEEELLCTDVIVCFAKNRNDRAHLVRTFMFLGFTTLPPGNNLIPNGPTEDMLYMAYTTM